MTFNWVDLLFVVLFARGIYAGRKDGLLVELFKLFSVFCALFVALHYYASVGDFLEKMVIVPKDRREIYAFVLLSGVIYFLFVLIREGWLMILKIPSGNFLTQWGGMIVAVVRAYVVCGLVWFGLVISGSAYVAQAANQSLSSFVFKNASANYYAVCYERFVVRFFPDEPLNKNVFKALEEKKK